MPWTAFLSPASGVPLDMVPDRMAWFRRSVAVPALPPFSRFLLRFDAVNFHATVFVNGELCGEHVGDAIPFDVDITDFVTPGGEAKGHVTGVASAVDSPREYGLLTIRAGRGCVVLDQVRWDIDTTADARAGRYISTLLTNLGVPLSSVSWVERSGRCEFVDISGACNATLNSPLPGEVGGWTGRGPDSDLSAFVPGALIAAGVPFRVAEETPERPHNCCVLGPGRQPAAPPIVLAREASSLGFLVACEGHTRHGTAIAHLTVQYKDGLETQIPLRFGVDVLDWNERGRHLDNALVAWRGTTGLGEPAVFYVRMWDNTRPDERIRSVRFSTTRAGVAPILLALTALS